MRETTWPGRLYRFLFKPNPFQRITAGSRALPDFLIIGAMRAGTTSLYHLIGRHPGVRPGVTKEVHFFDLNFGKGENWYRAHFPRRPQVSSLDWITGESSPYYLFHPLAARRAAGVLPDARLLVMLRDPVERAYSHYWHSVRYGYEKRPIEQAIEEEAQVVDVEDGKLRVADARRSFAHQHHSYLARGRYAEQLEEWFRHFPREQFLILEQRRFYDYFEKEARRLQEFLGLEPRALPGRHYNQAHYPESEAETLDRLRAYFMPFNRQLEDLLGEKFDW